MPVEIEFAKEIREICIRLLTRREHSQRELLDKLAIKGYDHAAVQAVLDKLVSEGWQSDDRFAESYARYRIKKGFGPVKITYELGLRGVSGFDLELVILDLAESWSDLMEQVYRKKYADEGRLPQKEWLKRRRFLQQRGFSSEMVNKFLK